VIWTDVDEPDQFADVDVDQYMMNKSHTPVELAVTGKAFNYLVDHDLIRKYLLDIRVFARMTPTGKVQCIQLHMERGITAMTGDGGNDCGALRAAHVGLALSEAEASIVSPFSTGNR
jgi:cation-transporting ATPase 13A3/4/5